MGRSELENRRDEFIPILKKWQQWHYFGDATDSWCSVDYFCVFGWSGDSFKCLNFRETLSKVSGIYIDFCIDWIDFLVFCYGLTWTAWVNCQMYAKLFSFARPFGFFILDQNTGFGRITFDVSYLLRITSWKNLSFCAQSTGSFSDNLTVCHDRCQCRSYDTENGLYWNWSLSMAGTYIYVGIRSTNRIQIKNLMAHFHR